MARSGKLFLYVAAAAFLLVQSISLIARSSGHWENSAQESPDGLGFIIPLEEVQSRPTTETNVTSSSGVDTTKKDDVIELVVNRSASAVTEIRLENSQSTSENTALSSRVSGNATVLDCLFQLEKPLRNQQREWEKKKIPILHSMVRVNNRYKVLFILWPIKGSYDTWTKFATWKCDGVHSPTEDMVIGNKAMFMLDCPPDVKNISVKSNLSPKIQVYKTKMLRQCADFDVTRGLPSENLHKVACNMVRESSEQLREWLIYHRHIGYDYFLIYVNEPYNATLLPQAPDITYIPWDYVLQRRDLGIPHQAAQQDDCILRAQARNVTWLALHDVDEYVRVMDNTTTLDAILRSNEDDPNLGGIQLPSWFFGEKYERPKNATNATAPSQKRLMIDRTWRKSEPYGRSLRTQGGREKMFIRPHNVKSFACHKIFVGGPMKDEPRLRLHHYKWVAGGLFGMIEGGVFMGPKDPTQLVYDDTLPQQYGQILRDELRITSDK